MFLLQQPKLQWASFKQYHQLYTVGKSVDHSAVKSMIDCAFPDLEHVKEIECKEPLQERVINVPCLESILCEKELCVSPNEVKTKLECSCEDPAREGSICTWKALLHSFFRKKNIELNQVKWRRNFLHLFSLKAGPSHTPETSQPAFATSKDCALLGVSDDQSKKIQNKSDPIYSGFGKLKNGFYVSSNGLVFSSEAEVHTDLNLSVDLNTMIIFFSGLLIHSLKKVTTFSSNLEVIHWGSSTGWAFK